MQFISFKRATTAAADNPLLRRPVTTTDPLPTGWEVRFSDHGVPFYIDHVNRVTTYSDPRPLPRYVGMRVVSASALRKSDTFGHADPYVLTRIRRPGDGAVDPMSLKKNARSAVFLKTDKKKRTGNPEWDEAFFFSVLSRHDVVEVYVYDWERGRKDQLLGYLAIPAAEVFVHTVAMDDQMPIWAVQRELTDPPQDGGRFKSASIGPEGSLSLEFAMVGAGLEGGTDPAHNDPDAAREAAAAKSAAEAASARARCTACYSALADAVNAPCGHMFLCMECAQAFRDEAGQICNTCREDSTITQIVMEQTCSVCYGDYDASQVLCLGSCGHNMCVACTVEVVRGALGDVAEQFPLQCPCISEEDGSRCPDTVGIESVRNLVKMSARVLPYGQALTAEEYDRFNMYNNIAAVPLADRAYCVYPDCGGLLILEDGCDTPGDTIIACGYCSRSFCYGCSVDHSGMTCEEHHAALAGNDQATRDLIGEASFPCPQCDARLVHNRGHRCHHTTSACVCGWKGCASCGGTWPCRGRDADQRWDWDKRTGACPTYCAPPVWEDRDGARVLTSGCACPPCFDCTPSSHCSLCSNDGRCQPAGGQ